MAEGDIDAREMVGSLNEYVRDGRPGSVEAILLLFQCIDKRMML